MGLSTPKTVVATLLAASAAVVVLITVLFKDAIHDWLFAIRRVRTWGDLLAQKPIQLSDGVIVRLGIEDTRCPQGGGVLLYCLTEGYDPDGAMPRSFSIRMLPGGPSVHSSQGAGLGPLEVSVLQEGAVEPTTGQASDVEVLTKKTTARLLFARSIPVPRSGKYRVTVSDHGKALQHVTVRGTNEFTHPLLTLEESGNGPMAGRLSLRGTTLVDGPAARILPCQGSAAIPAWRGLTPCMEADPRMDPARELPRLFPDADGPPEFDLRGAGPSLIVTSRNKIRFSTWNFAARWWVNGLPHVSIAPGNPSRSSLVRKGLILHNELDHDVEQCLFVLDFDAPGGEVRSGDRVSLQLLYSDQGWSLMEGGEEFFLLTSKEHRVLQSNRIELTVP